MTVLALSCSLWQFYPAAFNACLFIYIYLKGRVKARKEFSQWLVLSSNANKAGAGPDQSLELHPAVSPWWEELSVNWAVLCYLFRYESVRNWIRSSGAISSQALFWGTWHPKKKLKLLCHNAHLCLISLSPISQNWRSLCHGFFF